MPTFVDPSKCDGCKGGEKTACMYICPNDLMILDPEEMKAYNQEPGVVQRHVWRGGGIAVGCGVDGGRLPCDRRPGRHRQRHGDDNSRDNQRRRSYRHGDKRNKLHHDAVAKDSPLVQRAFRRGKADESN